MHRRVSSGRMSLNIGSMIVSAVSLILSSFVFGVAAQADPPGHPARSAATASPIKHVIIIVGENRSFDHIFATYQPKRHSEKVLNLLSQGIVKADGTPNFAKAHQFQLTSAPNAGKYFIGADVKSKALYAMLPPPDIGGVPAVSPLAFILSVPGGDPGLPPQDQFLFGTGGTGLAATLGPDTRITNVNRCRQDRFS
jgi:phospholipase C